MYGTCLSCNRRDALTVNNVNHWLCRVNETIRAVGRHLETRYKEKVELMVVNIKSHRTACACFTRLDIFWSLKQAHIKPIKLTDGNTTLDEKAIRSMLLLTYNLKHISSLASRIYAMLSYCWRYLTHPNSNPWQKQLAASRFGGSFLRHTNITTYTYMHKFVLSTGFS